MNSASIKLLPRRKAASVARRRARQRPASDLRPPTSALRPPALGFTLIELLVVVMIILVLAVVTVSAINITIDGDKVRAGARQVQSYLEGARSRAIYSKEPRGVRFLLDPTDNRTVSSMVYIAPTDPWTEGTVVLERPDADNDGVPAFDDNDDPMNPSVTPSVPPFPLVESADDVFVLRGFDGAEDQPPFSSQSPAKSTNWKDLYDRGVLRDGNVVEVPPGSKNYYTIDTRLLKIADTSDGSPPVRLLLQSRYRTLADTQASGSGAPPVLAFNKAIRYQLQLSPAPLPNQEPTLLPKGVVIHLDRCSSDPDGRFFVSGGNPSRNAALRGDRLPSTWKVAATAAASQGTGFTYSPYCDLMFAPRGMITGPEASTGLIHLYVGEQKDADRDRTDWSVTGPSSVTNWWSAPEYLPMTTASDPNGTPYQRGDKLVVSIFTRTGAITSNPIHTDDDNNSATDNNPASTSSTRVGKRFIYSETGEVAGK